jgi:hypothetical protein
MRGGQAQHRHAPHGRVLVGQKPRQPEHRGRPRRLHPGLEIGMTQVFIRQFGVEQKEPLDPLGVAIIQAGPAQPAMPALQQVLKPAGAAFQRLTRPIKGFGAFGHRILRR